MYIYIGPGGAAADAGRSTLGAHPPAGSIKALFRLYSGSIKAPFRLYSGS
jgi:hypothetical protein